MFCCSRKTIFILLFIMIVVFFAFPTNAQTPDEYNTSDLVSVSIQGYQDYGTYDGEHIELWGDSGEEIPLTITVTNISNKTISFKLKMMNNNTKNDNSFLGIANSNKNSVELAPNESSSFTTNIIVPENNNSSITEGYLVFYNTIINSSDEVEEFSEEDISAHVKSENAKNDENLESEQSLENENTEDNEINEDSNQEDINDKDFSSEPSSDFNTEESNDMASENIEEPFNELYENNEEIEQGSYEHKAMSAFSHISPRFISVLNGLSPKLLNTTDSTALNETPSDILTVRVNSISPMALLSLTLDSVPSFSFGSSNLIKNSLSTYPASAVNGNITVTDGRLVSLGWKLTAQMGNFSNGTRSNVLSGSVMNLPVPAMKLGGVVVQFSGASSAQMSPGESSAHTILAAGVGVALGTWTGTYDVNSVNLSVMPGTVYSGTNTSTILWTLYDSP